MKAQRRPNSRTALADAIAAFREEVRRLALAMVRRELDRLGAMPLSVAAVVAATRDEPAAATRDEPAADPDAAYGGPAATARVASTVAAVTGSKPWRQERSHTRREELAQRRQWRQERARQRRAAARMRAPATGTPAPTAVVRAESAMPVRVECAMSEVVATPEVVSGTRDELQPQERAELATAAEPRQEPATSPVSGRKRARWTRDAIITELASWVMNGSAVDASFVKRHGPPGLVAAALREFGRFDAALNVASLQVARLYPDGPPAR